MTLAQFMRDRSMSNEAMAALIGGASPGAVRKWKYGERTPRPKFLARIREVTDGRVTANDFVPRTEQAA